MAVILFLIPAFAAEKLNWSPWSDDVFARAKRENKFVLLDLEAVWCHWCHVMDETTYQDPATVALLKSKYILVRVDQDSRPDLSNRYEDYGWPATVVFDAKGQEIVKRQGYIPPRQMASMLKAIIDDPTPGPSVVPEKKVEFSANAVLSPGLRMQLEKTYLARYDSKEGSWGFDQKFLDWDGVEYAVALARKGDKRAEHMALQTLDAQLNLIDPAWGGVYQYSTGGNWKEPHFEKIMQFQAANMRIYSLAYEQWRNLVYLKAALNVWRFLDTFLTSPDGAFYTSMNADLVDGQHSAKYFQLDDAGRRKLGIPRIDRHIYARENGWVIEALASLYEATSDDAYLVKARRAAEWILKNRAIAGGGFRHDAKDPAGPYLGDTLAMSRAFLKLYEATGERAWLQRAEAGVQYINTNFKSRTGAGFVTSLAAASAGYKPRPERDENIALARLANLLSYYSGDPSFRKIAEESMRYAVTPAIASQYMPAGTLLADLELNTPPVHLTIVGSKDDASARGLFQTALQFPSGYKRVEWWDRREGKLPNPDVQYPELKLSAAFICTEKSCSSPIYKADKIRSFMSR